MVKYITSTVLISILCLGLTGCPAGGTKWDKAAELSDNFQVIANQAEDFEISIHKLNKISDEDHLAIQKAVLEVAKDGKLLDSDIKTGAATNSTVAAFNATIDALQKAVDSGAAHIKDPTTLAEFDAILLSGKGVLDSMKVLAGGK